jgi:hypothetical protein
MREIRTAISLNRPVSIAEAINRLTKRVTRDKTLIDLIESVPPL